MKKTMNPIIYVTILGATPSAFAGPIQFDRSVPADQKTLLQGDLNRLSSSGLSLKATESDPQFSRVFEKEALRGADLVSWIQTRVRVIVGETLQLSKASISKSDFMFSRIPTYFPRSSEQHLLLPAPKIRNP